MVTGGLALAGMLAGVGSGRKGGREGVVKSCVNNSTGKFVECEASSPSRSCWLFSARVISDLQ